MLSKLIGFFTPARYDAFVLLIESHGGINCVHLVPEDPAGFVEHVNGFTGSAKHPPRLPSTVASIGPREPLGELPVNVTEGESLQGAVMRLGDHVKEAYDADSKDGLASGADAGDDSESRLRACEHVLRRGFSAMLEERSEHGKGAIPAQYTVQLVRISRTRPGRIWDDSMLTSFPD